MTMMGAKFDRRPGEWRFAVWLSIALAVGLAGCAEKSRGRAADSVLAGAPGTTADAARDAVEAPARAGRRQVVFAGTSITAGLGLDAENAYPRLVAAKIDSAGLPYDVVNAGVSGETTAGLLRRVDWLVQQPFDVMVIESGANDGLRALDVATARDNLRQVIERVRSANPEAAIVLAQMEAPPNLGQRYTTEFREMYAELARDLGLVLMPFLLDGVAGERGLNQADGIHPNEEGARRIAENVWRALEPVLRGREEG
jgi:acyl-CoA thioesterase I